DTDITDFHLFDASGMGTIEGEVSINGADAEQYATISYRKEVGCSVECEFVEIKSINVLNNAFNMDGYETELPMDSYNRVASTYGDGYTTQTFEFDVLAGTNDQAIHDIQF
ncbi:MAG: hypothetical protein AB1Z31_01630, partial [Desulfobacterales bacterium]